MGHERDGSIWEPSIVLGKGGGETAFCSEDRISSSPWGRDEFPSRSEESTSNWNGRSSSFFLFRSWMASVWLVHWRRATWDRTVVFLASWRASLGSLMLMKIWSILVVFYFIVTSPRGGGGIQTIICFFMCDTWHILVFYLFFFISLLRSVTLCIRMPEYAVEESQHDPPTSGFGFVVIITIGNK